MFYEEALALLPPQFRLSNVKVVSGLTFRGTPKPDGADTSAHVPEPWDGPIIYWNCVFVANGASEALKLPKKFWVAFIGCTGEGGVEDVIDINRGGHLWFINFTFNRGPAQRDVTCKGGAHDVNFIMCTGLNKLVLGDYTKYDAKRLNTDGSYTKALPWRLVRPRTRDVHIEGGNPAVECIHAANPTGSARVSSPVRPFAGIYFWARATFWSEVNPPPPEEFRLLPEEV